MRILKITLSLYYSIIGSILSIFGLFFLFIDATDADPGCFYCSENTREYVDVLIMTSCAGIIFFGLGINLWLQIFKTKPSRPVLSFIGGTGSVGFGCALLLIRHAECNLCTPADAAYTLFLSSSILAGLGLYGLSWNTWRPSKQNLAVEP